MNPFTEKIGLKASELWLQTKQNYLILILRKNGRAWLLDNALDSAPLRSKDSFQLAMPDAAGDSHKGPEIHAHFPQDQM